MRHFKTEAIVLKKKNLLNRDNIVILFTHEKGKIGVFAKGIKKITSRRLPHIQTGNIIEALIYKKQDRFYLQETKLISHLIEIKKNSEKTHDLYFFLFILDRLLPENQKEEPVYHDFKRFISQLAKKEDKSILNQHLNKLLKSLGYIKEDLDFFEAKRVTEEIIGEKIPEFIL